MLCCTSKQNKFYFSLLSVLCNLSPLQADPVYFSEANLFYRNGFASDSPNTIWTDADSERLTFAKESSISIPAGLDMLLNSQFVPENQTEEFSIQLQFKKEQIKHLKSPSLKLFKIGEKWELYQNGKSIYKSETDRNLKLKPFFTSLLPLELAKNQTEEILFLTLHVYGRKMSPNFGLVLQSSDKIDESTQILFETTEIFPFFTSAIFLLLGFYLNYLYVRVKQLKAVLYFGLFQLAYALLAFTMSNYAMHLFGDSSLVQLIETNAIYLSFLFIICFHDIFLLNKIQKLTKFSIAVSTIILLLNTFSNSYFPNLISVLTIIETPMLFFYLYVFYTLLKKDFTRNKRSKKPQAIYCVFFRNKAGILITIMLIIATAIYFETFLEWNFNVNTPLVLISTILYCVFMAMYVIQKLEDGLIQKATLTYARIHDKKQYELEKQLTIQRERELTFNDIHDETSADLTFVKLKIEKFVEEGALNPKKANEVLVLIHRISTGIRQKLQSFDDERNVRDNLADGLTLLLLRKYESTGRIINIDTDKIENLSFNFSKKKIENLCKIIREIANNDSKYGEFTSTWNFYPEKSFLVIELISISKFRKGDVLPGLGHKNIEKLATEIDASITESKDGSDYKIQLKLKL